MSLKFKRALNAFLIGFAATAAMLYIEDRENLTRAVSVGDWSSLKVMGLALLSGGIAGGIRALQSGVPVLPSPEPEENARRTG